MTEHFCTYFNRNYLVRGVALYQSLAAHTGGDFVLWVLCLDDSTYDTLEKLAQANLRPVRLSTLEQAEPDLLAVKPTRSTIEYYFTCSPTWTLYLLSQHPEIERITYLDSDMLFFGSPAPIFEEMGTGSVLIIPHRFPESSKHLEIYGKYNVGLLSFRSDVDGKACLLWWRDRCIEWCYDRLEDGKFADQKYLDEWTPRFHGVVELQHIGVNVAPWNWMQYRIQRTGNRLTADDQPLILFHFQGLKLLNRWLYDPGYYAYTDHRLPAQSLVYPLYIDALRQAHRWLAAVAPETPPGYTGIFSRSYGRKTFFTRLLTHKLNVLLNPV